MIEFSNKPPQWDNVGVEPTDKKTTGYIPKDTLPADYVNWFWHKVGECLEELQVKLSNENTARESITAENVGAAKSDLSNVEDAVFNEKAESAGTAGIPIVNGTSTNGVAYTATVQNLNIKVGTTIAFIPNMTSTSKSTTLDVNDMGAIRISQGLSSQTSPMVSANSENWLSAERPILLMYHETTNTVGTVTKCWKTVATRTTNEDVYGTMEIEGGGTGASNAFDALLNLGGAHFKMGTYKGVGEHGSANYNTLSFDFPPKALFIVGDYRIGIFVLGSRTNEFTMCGTVISTASPSGEGCIPKSLNVREANNTVTWFSENETSSSQLNKEDELYFYCAIG